MGTSGGSERDPKKGPRWLAPAIFCTIFFAYMASTSRERPWGDANPVYQVAESLVTRGALDVGVRWPPDMPPGRNGKFYATNPLINSLVLVPGAALHQAIVSIWPRAAARSLPLTCHLAPAALGALSCLIFFWICRQQGASPRLASGGALMLAFATSTWVYARMPYTEIVQMAFFTGFFAALLRALEAPTTRTACILGIWAGLLINSKVIYVVVMPGTVLLLAATLRRDRRRLLSMLLWAGLMLVPAFGLIFFYNWARWGSLLNTGYGGAGGVFSRGTTWHGLWGLFLSPGKSWFLYNPILVLGLVALPLCVARYRRVTLAMAATFLPVVLVYARFPFWSGDFAWGPRYIVFAIPMATLPVILYLKEKLIDAKSAVPMMATAALVACGVFVQVLGNAFYWDHFIRLSMEARSRWLGVPNRGGSVSPDRGGYCDACFEDTHQLLWLPPFQPIIGNWWALKHVPFGHDWITAEADAPWHKSTTLRLDIAGTYRRFRVDWWGLDYEQMAAERAALLAIMLGLTGASAYFWRRGTGPVRRRSDPAPLAEDPVPG